MGGGGASPLPGAKIDSGGLIFWQASWRENRLKEGHAVLALRIGFNTNPYRIQHFWSIRIRMRIQTLMQGFGDHKFWKLCSWIYIYLYFLNKKCNLLFLRPSYRRSLHPTKDNIQHFKTWHFFTFVGHFCPPGSGSSRPKWMRIWIRNTAQKGKILKSQVRTPINNPEILPYMVPCKSSQSQFAW